MSYIVISQDEALRKLSALADSSSPVRVVFNDGAHSIFGGFTGSVASVGYSQIRIASSESDSVIFSLSKATTFEFSDLIGGVELPRKFKLLTEHSGRFTSCLYIAFSCGASCVLCEIWRDSDFIEGS